MSSRKVKSNYCILLNLGPYFSATSGLGHLYNGQLGELGSISPSRLTAQGFAPAAASSKCDFTSSRTQSIYIIFNEVEPILSSLAAVSESDSHSILIMCKSYVLCPAHEDQVV